MQGSGYWNRQYRIYALFLMNWNVHHLLFLGQDGYVCCNWTASDWQQVCLLGGVHRDEDRNSRVFSFWIISTTHASGNFALSWRKLGISSFRRMLIGWPLAGKRETKEIRFLNGSRNAFMSCRLWCSTTSLMGHCYLCYYKHHLGPSEKTVSCA